MHDEKAMLETVDDAEVEYEILGHVIKHQVTKEPIKVSETADEVLGDNVNEVMKSTSLRKMNKHNRDLKTFLRYLVNLLLLHLPAQWPPPGQSGNCARLLKLWSWCAGWRRDRLCSRWWRVCLCLWGGVEGGLS